MLLNFSVDGTLNWATIVPKNQVEQAMAYSPARKGNLWREGDYCFGSNDAFFGSFNTQFGNDALYIFLNDNSANRNVISNSQKANDLKGAINLQPFLLSCDYKSGVITRKELIDDGDNTVPLFPKALCVENTLYFPLRSHSGFDGSKFGYRIGKIQLK
jgi:hypothetical protein